jgi:hypothetical protein
MHDYNHEQDPFCSKQKSGGHIKNETSESSDANTLFMRYYQKE